ncbi:hypothetical protein PC110_g5069 [Phytophthora cactorum]|uniref:Uncharacterized protein n=2 Tax=Phytophthora cactorum TaxID=29920 RepID=A0A329SSZ4_9STRA|nr:hypothetical protein PC110_g5069 [Phytophthora cactorum]
MVIIKMFLVFLQSRRAPLACNDFTENQLNRSITIFKGLRELKLDPGACVVGASCERQIKRCFVLCVYGDKRPRQEFDQFYEGGEGHEFYDEPLKNLLWIRRCHFIFRFERAAKVALDSGSSAGNSGTLKLRTFEESKCDQDSGKIVLPVREEDDEDPRDEVEIIEMCVHDTEAEICAAPDSQLLKRARIGYIKHLEVARKERAELRRRNRQNMRNAEISVEMLERYKNVEGGPNGP